MKISKRTPSYADLAVRIKAFAIDYLFIAAYLLALTGLGLFLRRTFPAFLTSLFGNLLSGEIASFITLTLPVILYFSLLESSLWQATVGKKRNRLKVVDVNGVGINGKHAFIRNMLKFVPWELSHISIRMIMIIPAELSYIVTTGFFLSWLLVGVNVISMLFSPAHQTLYDRLAGTYVVLDQA
jgi:uncharacterized RDD family membrane protein YckC